MSNNFPLNQTPDAFPTSEPIPLLSSVLANQAADKNEKTTLNLKANPQLIIPGVPISIEWSVNGWQNVSGKSDLKAVVQFPNDVKTNEISPAITTAYDRSTMDLPITAAVGKTSFSVGSTSKAPFLVDVSINTGSTSYAANSILVTKPTLEAIFGKDNHLISKDGKVTLDFTATVLSESLYLDVRDPSPSSIAGYSLSGNPVEIVAVGMTSKKNVDKFAEPFTLTMKYDPDHLYGGSVDDLAIYYFDETIEDWLPVPTIVDQENETLIAQVDHLTVFDYQANSWQGYRLPTIDQAQVSGNSGAATYQMSFWLPPAPGNFTPSPTDTPTATPTPQGGIARYYYDGDGNMVKSVIDDITTYSPSAAYQVKTNGTDTNTRKYYSFNGAVVAMRENGVVTWLQQDQVNSTTITADANGNLLTETRYSAFGEIRYTNGITVTDKMYTGQQQETEIGLDYYIARFYDPVIGHFIQPDSLIPQASASASYDRYAYVNGNPVNFNDPSGHCPWCIVGALVGAAAGYGIQVYNNYQNGYTGSAAWTQNISAEPIVGGALIGAGAVIFAPAAVAAVGDVLVGVGVTTGSTALFGAGMSAYGASTALGNAITGAPAVTTAPALNTSNEIGAWGEQQVGANLPVNIQQQSIRDPFTGELRIYDGNFIHNPNAFVEVKTSTRGVVYANQFIKNQIAKDANIGASLGTPPTWVFVNARPSGPLMDLLQQKSIFWHQLHIAISK